MQTTITEILSVRMSDGVEIVVRIRRPVGTEPVPALFAASPYRFDNDEVPETGIFLWRETGPIDWYVSQGYAYVHADVRGSGRSEGTYGFFDRRERRDLYEMIEWIAARPWSNGRVGGIGHSYYATTQWCMAAERPPHLACIAPYDGHVDLYRGWAYTGGIPGRFMSEWWNGNVRPINLNPANGEAPRDLEFDLPHAISRHPTLDDFWRERSFAGALDAVTIPVYSIGVWCKRDLHLAGNIEGFQRVGGPKKLLVTGAPHMSAAQADFESVAFHERVLLPFYDRWLKEAETDYESRPAVAFHVRGGGEAASTQWPPADSILRAFYLASGPTGSVTSLNDGALAEHPAESGEVTSYSYPDHRWMLGHVTFTATGPDPVRRVLTFTSSPLADGMEVAGSGELVLYGSSSRTDMDVIVKLSEQKPQAAEDRARGIQPLADPVTKGWLRGSHRALAAERSVDGAPVPRHDAPQPLRPGTVYELRVPLVPMAHRFAAGSRIRIEIACADSPITDAVFAHIFTPDTVGTDSIHHSAEYPSRLLLPVRSG